ncbi:Wzz/FepE/Etk N-terminal domain-containing protein [Tenacibaculum aestuariivivum]|uniref:Wzz/FepE/Etk N-terminal domain-containing protein n=1 Tax=Tenacibaculum aestuariivivum TaxID=2006131 RepID=UPI003AB66AC0
MVKKSTYYNAEGEIDLLALFKTIWTARRTVIRFIIIFGLLGIFIAIFSPKQYTASTILVPQLSKGASVPDLGGLAILAGINLERSSLSKSISPHLYPKITESVLFRKELLKVPLKFSYLDKDITYEEYYLKYKKTNVLSFIKNYTVRLPGKFFSLFKKNITHVVDEKVRNDSIYRVSVLESKLMNLIGSQLKIDINGKEGYVELMFSMPEALPAAQMTKKAKDILQRIITNFKVQKTKEELIFIEERYKELKKDFEKKQANLASFRDRNQGLITFRSKSRLERLNSDYNLAYTIYSEMAKQLEKQKIKLKENTPLFTVIKPVTVPILKSRPNRVLIFVKWLFLGIIIGVGFVFGKVFVKKNKR